MTEQVNINIIELLFKQHSLSDIASKVNLPLAKVNKVIKDNSELIDECIKDKLPKEWGKNLTDDIKHNIYIYNLYVKSLHLTPELLDLKTKDTYYKLLDLSLSTNLTIAQSRVLSSLLSYFAKSIDDVTV